MYNAIRQAVGSDFIVGVKFPFNDLNEHSIREEESLFVCQELERQGIDFIEVSSGMVMDNSEASLLLLSVGITKAPFL